MFSNLTFWYFFQASILIALAIGASVMLKKFRKLRTRVNQLREELSQQLESNRQLIGRVQSIESKTAQCSDVANRANGWIDHNAGRIDHFCKVADHLLGEETKMFSIPSFHPGRLHFKEAVLPRMREIIDDLVPVLFPNQMAADELDWMYRLKTCKFPYSLTLEEGMILHKLVVDHQFKEGYEIATAFGFSSFFLGLAFQQNKGRLLSVDAYIEESKEDFIYEPQAAREHADRITKAIRDNNQSQYPIGYSFAKLGSEKLGIAEHVEYRVGFSPDHVAEIVGSRKIDFAFVDGGHFDEQPMNDVLSLIPLLNRDRFMMVFHDTQCVAVARALQYASSVLDSPVFSINTRNRIVVLGRNINDRCLEECRAMVLRQVE